MAKYLFVYHGGGMAATEEERAESMAAWGRWAGELGSAVIDFGAPAGATTTVGGTTATAATGYSLISAESLDSAAGLANGCPILANGGSVEVAELMEM